MKDGWADPSIGPALRWGAIGLSTIVYAVFFVLLFPSMGAAAILFALLPVSLAGVGFGPLKGGAISTGFALFAVALLQLADPLPLTSAVLRAGPSLVILIYAGTALGALTEIARRHREERRRREKAEATAASLAEQNARLLSLGFLTPGVVFEINNPLAVVKGNEELAGQVLDTVLWRQDLPADVRRDLAQVADDLAQNRQSLDRIARIARTLHYLARTGGSAADTDLTALLDEVAVLARHRFSDGRRLVVEPGAERVMVRANPGDVGQAVLAMILRAAESAPPGSKVVLRPQRGPDGGSFVEVAQDGTGGATGASPPLLRVWVPPAAR